jgi:hypothetical protein
MNLKDIKTQVTEYIQNSRRPLEDWDINVATEIIKQVIGDGNEISEDLMTDALIVAQRR